MTEAHLIDTDVLIDYLRGHSDAIASIEGLTGPWLMSAVSLAELYAGVRDGNERVELGAFSTAFQVVEVNREIAVQGGLHRRNYRKSHNVSLNDALIAATAEATGVTLSTLNTKHFPMLQNVHMPYRKT